MWLCFWSSWGYKKYCWHSVNNVIGSSNKIVTFFGKFVVLSNKTDIIIQNVFFSQFLYGLQITHSTETSAVIQYTTPNCVIQNDLMVKLGVNYSNNYFQSIQSYESRMLIINDLKLNNILMCTLNVFYISPEDQSAVIFIGMTRTVSSTVCLISATTLSAATILSTPITTSVSSTVSSSPSLSMRTTPISLCWNYFYFIRYIIIKDKCLVC